MMEDSLLKDKQVLGLELEKLNDINKSISELGGLDKDRENNIKLLQFEIDEINNAELYDGEEEELKSRLTLMQNSEKIYGGLNDAINILDGDYSVSNVLKTAINTLNTMERFDDKLTAEKDRLDSIKYELDDIVSSLNSNLNNLSYSQEELDMVQDRLGDIKDLERKYGNTIEDILEQSFPFS